MKRWLELSVSAIFGFSALTKLVDFENSLVYFASVTSLTGELIRYSLAILIFLELFIAFTLPIKWHGQKIVQIGTLVMIVLFLGVSIGMATNGVKNCGCFGTFWVLNPWISVFKNITITVVVMLLRFDFRKPRYV